jgi:hypothetical protein
MPLVVTEPACADEVALIHQGVVYGDPADGPPRERRYVVASGVLLREGPSTSAVVYQKLGYGVEVAVIGRGCAEGWTLVASPYGGVAHGVGYIKDELLSATLLDIEDIEARVEAAKDPVELAAWTLIRAVYSPSIGHVAEAEAAHAEARASIAGQDLRPCDTHFGACELVYRDSDRIDRPAPVPRAIGAVGVAPWWTLPTATAPAELAFFRAAFLETTGECNCCGCVSCATTLEVLLAPLSEATAKRPPRPLGASRRPPGSWSRGVSEEGCEGAQARAEASELWSVPVWDGDEPPIARSIGGRCLPGEGTSWWVNHWVFDGEEGAETRSYAIRGGRVVAVRGTTPLAHRDLDGDGDAETLWECESGACAPEIGWPPISPLE